MSSSKLVSVAIDFGTTLSGYAFSLRHDKENIQVYMWKGNGYVSSKTPTCILFDPMKHFHSFGLEAEEKYADLSRMDDDERWYFFKQFKLAIHNTKGLGRHTMIKERGKKEMLALDVFAESIRYLKEHALGQLARTGAGGGISASDIQWVLTVPAIWDDSARQFMRLAAEKAGIQEQDLTFAFEPEAASVYCKTLRTECGIFQTVGTEYLVLDCGGGTVDVAVHRVQTGGKLKAIYRPSGGIWGGTKVDDEFQAFLAKICGMEAMKLLTKHEIIEIQRSFDFVKTMVTPTSQNYINVKLPINLLRSIDRRDRDGRYRLTGDKLSMSAELMRGFFEKSVNKIKQHIKTLLVDPELSGVQYIIMVGGFCLSEVLQEAIRREFCRLDVRQVPHAESAVVRGAVICGHEPRIIRCRKAAFTYGVRQVREFQGKDDRGKLKVIEGIRYCKDVFGNLISINDTVEVGKHKVTRSYTPVESMQTAMTLIIYRSTEPNPVYTTDPSCTRIGSLTVRMPDMTGGSDRTVEATFEFGDTELKIEAMDGNTGVKFTAQFDFMCN